MKPNKIIRLDKNTKTFYSPTLMLMTRDFTPLGKISKYYNWNISLKANGVDEISFDVDKSYYDEYGNKIICPVWDELIDLKIVDVDGFGKFEISVSYTDNTETIKSIHGVSLEVELGQLYLRDFHVNDEDSVAGDITEYNKMHFNEKGDFIPTAFYKPYDKDNSLLHRILADKAPHWNIGYVTPYVTLGENEEAEKVENFIRTYTVDGTDIYSFLTEDVAKETNVVFLFDTNTRTINCYSLEDCYVNGELVQKGIGEDTLIMISKKKLANEIGIESNKESVKNCFRVTGGDDLITSQVAAVNMNGSNYIYKFAPFQLADMPSELVDALNAYSVKVEENKDVYYGKPNGIYTRLVNAYEDLNFWKSTLMPETKLKDTTVEQEYENIVKGLTGIGVGISSEDTTLPFVNNNILAMAQVYCDSRYKVTLYKKESYGTEEPDIPMLNGKQWVGNIQVTRTTDESDTYPKVDLDSTCFNVELKIDSDKNYSDKNCLLFSKQKAEIALAKNDMVGITTGFFEDKENLTLKSDDVILKALEDYNLDMLKSFKDGYETCLSQLKSVGHYSTSDIQDDLYKPYYHLFQLTNEVYNERKEQVDAIQDTIDDLIIQQQDFQKEMNFPNNIGMELYLKLCAYIREDEYSNSNYISDNLQTTSDYLDKAKELLDVANAQLDKACMLQRTVSTSLNNLLILPEFEPLYDSFNLFNYIRVQSEDEMFKLRILEISIDGDNYSDINVTFAEQIEDLEGSLYDLQSIVSQASSISSSYDATMLQAKQGKKANSTFDEMSDTGIDASKYAFVNDSNNELTMSAAGLVAKKMTDVGSYDDKQLKITANGLFMTDDNWATIKEAIGEVDLGVDEHGNHNIGYGVIADNIIGKFILGEKLEISNEESSVIITGDYIKLGTIANGATEEVPHPTGIELNKDGSVTFTSYSTGDFGAENSANLTFSLSDGLIISGTSYLPSSQGNTEWFDYTLRLSPKVDPSGTGDIITFEGTDSHGTTTSWGIDRSGNIGHG